jgi:MFS family permease
LIDILMFEVGSIICAVAKSPTTLIVGRATQGVGSSGVTVGLFSLASLVLPHRLPSARNILV